MAKLEEKAILVRPTIGCYEGRIKDKRVESDIDEKYHSKNAGSFYKRLFDCSEFKAMETIANRFRRKVHDVKTLAWGRDGTGILPIESYEGYVQAAREAKDSFEQAYNKFDDMFDDQLLKEEKRLNGLFDRNEYPTKAELRKKFYFEINFYPIPQSSDFRLKAQHDDIQEIMAGFNSKKDEILKDALKEPYERLHAAIKNIHEKLSKSSQFKKNMIENLAELTQILPTLNITGDPKLTELTKLAEEELASLDPQDLRDSKELKTVTTELAEEMLKQMEEVLL